MMVTLWAVPSFSSQSIPRKANNIFDGRLESMEEYIGNSPLTLSRSTAAHFWYAVFLKSEPDAPRGGRSPIRLALFVGPTEG